MFGDHKDKKQRWCLAHVSKWTCCSMIRTLQNSAMQHSVPCTAIFCLLECSCSGSKSARRPKHCTAYFEWCIATFGFLHCSFCLSCNFVQSFCNFSIRFCNLLMSFATFWVVLQHLDCNVAVQHLFVALQRFVSCSEVSAPGAGNVANNICVLECCSATLAFRMLQCHAFCCFRTCMDC